jgi:enoyl-CoA hydratase/carnithine racemase
MADVLIETGSGVRTITLNRPEKRNAFTPQMYRAIADAIESADRDPAIRVVLLQANGDLFSAGNDLAEFRAINEGSEITRPSGEPMLHALACARKPLIAAVHGRAIGVGLTILLHCDLVYVAEDALLSCPFVDLALVPEAASSLLLPARIGHVRAFQLFALGEAIDGRTAAAWGLANAALPAGEVQAKARVAAEALAARPPSAIAATKSLMRDPACLQQRIEDELTAFVAQLRSDEAREALAAFFGPRQAR